MKLNRSLQHSMTVPHLGLAVAVVVLHIQRLDAAFSTNSLRVSRQSKPFDSTSYCSIVRRMTPSGPAGSFFNPIPNEDSADDGDAKKNDIYIPMPTLDIGNQIQQPIGSPLPTRTPPAQTTDPFTNGFTKPSTKNSYIAIDAETRRTTQQPRKQSLNNLNQPLRDEQGYTLYADEVTGEKTRVFQALVSYPCEFTLKIVGLADNGLFVQDMVAAVAARCDVSPDQLTHSTRAMGKWASLTVQAPVQNADMLYTLYDMLDQDPRVKFKF